MVAHGDAGRQIVLHNSVSEVEAWSHVQIKHSLNIVIGREWVDTLRAFGWEGEEEALEQLSRFAMRNCVYHWSQLEHVDDPSEWIGADEIPSGSMEFLRALMRRGKQVPRQDMIVCLTFYLSQCMCLAAHLVGCSVTTQYKFSWLAKPPA